MKRTPAILLLVFLLTACAPRSNYLPCHATPASFCEVFAKIDDSLSQEQRESLRGVSSSNMASLHFGFSAGLRNSFHLWEDNDLTRYFRSLGVDHPDIMSDVLAQAYIAYLNGRTVDLPSIVRSGRPPPPPPVPPGWSQGHGR